MSSSIKYVKWIHVMVVASLCLYHDMGVVKMWIIRYEEKTGADPDNIFLTSFWTRTN